jgi:outer membrane lipoprotein SlyB
MDISKTTHDALAACVASPANSIGKNPQGRTMKSIIIMAIAAAALAGCVTTGQSPAQPVVDARAVGGISETILGVIVDVRAVQIKAQQYQRLPQILPFSSQPPTTPGFEIVVKVRDGKQDKLQTIVQQAQPGEAFATGQTWPWMWR